MNEIEKYAVELVADGAESTAEDDLNEDGKLSDIHHEEACGLAVDIATAIRNNPAAVLALVGH